MKLNNFVEGLKILQRHFNDQDGYHIGAEHDEFFVYATDKPIGESDLSRLVELGWHQPEADYGDEESYAESMYDPRCGWAAFT